MTFQEVEQRIGKQVESEWRQCSVGKGWIHKSAVVNSEVVIGEDAIVRGGTIWGGTIRGGTIRGGTIWGGTIRGGTIYGGTIRGGTIEGGTIWGGKIEGGTIEDGEWKNAPLFVKDSRGHGACNSKPGYLKIGCECHTFSDWKSRFPAIARKHNLTPKEKVEYEAIVDLFCRTGK